MTFIGVSSINKLVKRMSEEYDTVAPPDVKRMKTDETVERKRILYVVLEGCSLESGKCLLNLLDSPLNRAGYLRVFFRTNKNVLVQVSSQCRIPRTFDRFCGLMVQLLHKLVVRAADSSQKLLTVVKNPVSNYLPVGCRKILMTFNTEELILPNKLVRAEEEAPLVVAIGGIAKGKIITDYTDQEVKISNYPLSAALTCAKVTSGLEEIWGVV
ncbi:hypothetical protein KIN20_034900 [Parelaphostrongylus tenuis]|uniref:18S rRNA (pseudouridine-N1)-methyltransferase n=1 Tax=Parelaphostrongylus tenuis TaxID=148309 RepID=A0AAD5RAE1_PARTN|nr:hypothetical protein KIN20_034900 [Parelaphostrongylus tenuis]